MPEKSLKPCRCCTCVCSQGAWMTPFSRITLLRVSRIHHPCPQHSTSEPVPSCSHIVPLGLCTQNASSKTRGPHWESKHPRPGSLSGRAAAVAAAEGKTIPHKDKRKWQALVISQTMRPLGWSCQTDQIHVVASCTEVQNDTRQIEHVYVLYGPDIISLW